MMLPPRSLSSLLRLAATVSFSSIILLSICPLSKAQSPTPSPTPTPATPRPTAPLETRSPCDAFSTRQEAQAFFEHDPQGAANLDPNQDGQACEQLSTVLRTDGYRVSSGTTSDGWTYEIWKSSVRSAYSQSRNRVIYYTRAWRSHYPDTLLTTRNFTSVQAAYDYFVESLK